MNLARMDWMPGIAIALGTAAGLTVTWAAVGSTPAKTAGPVDAAATEWVARSATASVRVEPGAQAEIRLPSTPQEPDPGQPLVFLDGERVENVAILGSLDRERIDRVEVVKGDEALRRHGEGAARHGVVYVFTKPVASGPGGP